jgi:excisionase family DNA binding protein
MKTKKFRSRARLEREVQRLRREVRRLKRPRKITKRELQRFLRQDKTTKAIAKYYRVSRSTVNRKIREHGLTGLRKKGKKRLVKRPASPKPRVKWIETRKYINDLNKAYHFINIIYPPFKYVNSKTLVCSDKKANPKGKFTTVGIYFIVAQSDVFFINYSRIRYSDKPVNFDEIYEWLKENIEEILSVQFQKAAFAIEKIIAFTFLSPEKKPKAIKAKGGKRG